MIHGPIQHFGFRFSNVAFRILKMLKPTKLNTFKNCNFVKSLSVGQHVINRKIYLTVKEISKTPARRAA